MWLQVTVLHSFLWLSNTSLWASLGGSVVKNLPVNAGDAGDES